MYDSRWFRVVRSVQSAGCADVQTCIDYGVCVSAWVCGDLCGDEGAVCEDESRFGKGKRVVVEGVEVKKRFRFML